MEGARGDARPADWNMAAPQNASHRTHDNGNAGQRNDKGLLGGTLRRCAACIRAEPLHRHETVRMWAAPLLQFLRSEQRHERDLRAKKTIHEVTVGKIQTAGHGIASTRDGGGSISSDMEYHRAMYCEVCNVGVGRCNGCGHGGLAVHVK